jgi:trimethylamine:corrinoid methyltransferase-like protein
MMKHTLEKFVLTYVNATISITTTFDHWMSKGALDTFAQM